MYCLICWIAWLAAQCYGSSQWLFFPPILLLLLPLISDGSNSNVLEVLSGFDVTVHKNISKVVIRVLGVAAFVLEKPPPPLWGQQPILWQGWQLYKVFFEAGSTPSAPVVHPSFLVFLSKNAFHKSHFLVSHYSTLCEFRPRHAENQICIWGKSASSCCSQCSCKILHPWSILPMNFLPKGAVVVEWKRVGVFLERCWQEHLFANLT